MDEPVASGDEILELAPRRMPRRVRQALVGLTVVAAAGGIAAYAATRPDTPRAPVAAPSPVARTGADWTMVFLAREPNRLVDYVRSDSVYGACKVPEPSSRPSRAVVRAVRRTLPAYRVRDVGQVYDQYTGLCSVEVRAVNAAGSTLVLLTVSSHRPRSRPSLTVGDGARVGRTDTVRRVRAILPGGWSVTLGTVGPAADKLPTATMARLARDPALRW